MAFSKYLEGKGRMKEKGSVFCRARMRKIKEIAYRQCASTIYYYSDDVKHKKNKGKKEKRAARWYGSNRLA